MELGHGTSHIHEISTSPARTVVAPDKPKPMPWEYTLREKVMAGLDPYEITPTARLIFITIWASREKDPSSPDYGTADPAVSFIAEKACCHERTVSRLLPLLVARGLLERPFIAGPEARYTRVRNRYRFPARRVAPMSTAWRRGPTRQQVRDAARAAAKAAKLRSAGPRHGDVRALGATVTLADAVVAQTSDQSALVRIRLAMASPSMGGNPPVLALERPGSVSQSLPGLTGPESRNAGAIPRGAPPGVFPVELSKKLIALAGKLNGGGRPPPE